MDADDSCCMELVAFSGLPFLASLESSCSRNFVASYPFLLFNLAFQLEDTCRHGGMRRNEPGF